MTRTIDPETNYRWEFPKCPNPRCGGTNTRKLTKGERECFDCQGIW